MRLHEGYKLASEKRRNRQYSGGTENVIFGGKINQIKSTFFSFHPHCNIEVNHHNKKYFNSVFDSLLYNIKSYIKCIIKRQLFFSSVSVSSPPQKYRFTYFRKFFFKFPMKKSSENGKIFLKCYRHGFCEKITAILVALHLRYTDFYQFYRLFLLKFGTDG